MQKNNSDICFQWLGDIGTQKDAIWQQGYLPWKASHVITNCKNVLKKNTGQQRLQHVWELECVTYMYDSNARLVYVKF